MVKKSVLIRELEQFKLTGRVRIKTPNLSGPNIVSFVTEIDIFLNALFYFCLT